MQPLARTDRQIGEPRSARWDGERERNAFADPRLAPVTTATLPAGLLMSSPA